VGASFEGSKELLGLKEMLSRLMGRQVGPRLEVNATDGNFRRVIVSIWTRRQDSAAFLAIIAASKLIPASRHCS
jgi:hypothetical protein